MLQKYLSIFLFLILFIQSLSYAQDFKFSGTVGYATFNLSDMEKLQNQIISESDLPLKKTDTFPAQPYYQIQIVKQITSSDAIGIFGGFTTTGGRVTASDYSGRVTSDQLISAYQIGLHSEKRNGKGQIAPFVQTQLSVLFSKLKLKDEIIFTNSNNVETITLTSQNIVLEPAIGIQLDMLPVPLKFGVGFIFNITDFPFHLKGNKNAKLTINNSDVGASLSGFRLAISSSLEF